MCRARLVSYDAQCPPSIPTIENGRSAADLVILSFAVHLFGTFTTTSTAFRVLSFTYLNHILGRFIPLHLKCQRCALSHHQNASSGEAHSDFDYGPDSASGSRSKDDAPFNIQTEVVGLEDMVSCVCHHNCSHCLYSCGSSLWCEGECVSGLLQNPVYAKRYLYNSYEPLHEHSVDNLQMKEILFSPNSTTSQAKTPLTDSSTTLTPKAPRPRI
jgi:hypothetical protein